MKQIDSILIPEDMTHVNIYYEKGNITVGFSNEYGSVKLGDIIVNKSNYCKIVVLKEPTSYDFQSFGYQDIGKQNSKLMYYNQKKREVSEKIKGFTSLSNTERVLDEIERKTLLQHIEEETGFIWSDKEKRMIKANVK